MEEMRIKLQMMIDSAVREEAVISRKLEKLRDNIVTVAMCDKWNDLIEKYRCANERVRVLYEVRGRLGL